MLMVMFDQSSLNTDRAHLTKETKEAAKVKAAATTTTQTTLLFKSTFLIRLL